MTYVSGVLALFVSLKNSGNDIFSIECIEDLSNQLALVGTIIWEVMWSGDSTNGLLHSANSTSTW